MRSKKSQCCTKAQNGTENRTSQKNKIFELAIKKKDGRPGHLGTQTHKWVSLRTRGTKGRRKPPTKVRKSLGSSVVRTGLGYLETASLPGVRDPWDVQQSQGWIKTIQGGCQETQGMRTDMSLSATQ